MEKIRFITSLKSNSYLLVCMMSSLEETRAKVDKILSLLGDIKIKAIDILKKLEPVMKHIKDPKHEIVIQACEKYPQHDPKTIQDTMQQISIEWIKDASLVKTEIDKFFYATEDGFFFQTDPDICPFLAEVWNGDAYDAPLVEGLENLKKDLSQQFSKINRENLFLQVGSKLSR